MDLSTLWSSSLLLVSKLVVNSSRLPFFK
jgi:hypothetical protein